MVVTDGISIRLVDAVTKIPFQEHEGPNGKFYTEVEPDVQYFVEMNIVGGDADRLVMDAYVDGKRVPTHVTVRRNGGRYLLGINAEQADGSKTKTAFCFRTPELPRTCQRLPVERQQAVSRPPC